MGQALLKYANFTTIVKCRFYGLISLLLIEQHYRKTKPRSLLQKRRLKRYLELLTRIMGYPLLKYANFSTIVTFCFYGLKRLLLRKQHHQTTKPRSLLIKRRLKRCLELLSRFKRLPLSKYADFQTIVKCRFYGLKRLLLRKQHPQTTKPMFLLQQSRFERYLELVTGILR